MKTETLNFKIDGEDLVRIARSLWADELETVKAIGLLKDGLIGFTEDLAVRVLTGCATLVGVNDVQLVPDDATKTEYGNLLSATSVMGRVKANAEDVAFDLLVVRQQRSGVMRLVASPWGAGKLPLCVFHRLMSDEWTWDHVKPYFEDVNRSRVVARAFGGLDEEDDPDYGVDDGGSYTPADAAAFDKTRAMLDTYAQQEADREKLENTPPEPADDFKSENGWIDRQGNFYICGILQHDFLAGRMGKEVKALEKTHVRVSKHPMSDHRASIQFVGRKATKAQQSAVMDWCTQHGEKFPKNLFD